MKLRGQFIQRHSDLIKAALFGAAGSAFGGDSGKGAAGRRQELLRSNLAQAAVMAKPADGLWHGRHGSSAFISIVAASGLAALRQRAVGVHQAARAHLPVNQLPRWESAGTPLKPIKNAAVVIWVAEWSIGRQELMVHGVHRCRDRATQCKGFHVDQRAHLDEAHVQQKTAVAIECSQHRSRDAGDPPGVLALLHCRLKGTGERAVAIERQTDKDHVTTRTLR